MNVPPLGDMPTQEFRESGQRLVDWLGDYFDWSLENPVLSRIAPGTIERVLMPGLTQ